jgi:hypothetical protein
MSLAQRSHSIEPPPSGRHAYASDLGPYYALLAYRWARARVRRMVEYLEKGGQRAIRGGAFRAVLFLTQAVEAGRWRRPVRPRRRGFWEKGLGVAQYYLGDLQTSQQH